MVERGRYRGVRPEPDMETVIRIGWTITILAFIVTVISFVGEYRGWWSFAGEVGATAGAIVTVLVGVGTLTASAGRVQVGGVREAVEDNGETLGDIDEQLDKLDSMDSKLDKLDDLDKLDAIDDDLDRVGLQLDKQTGVLGRQVEILEQIRDNVGSGDAA